MLQRVVCEAARVNSSPRAFEVPETNPSTFKGQVFSLKEDALHRIHGRGFCRGQGEEAGIEQAEVFSDEVPAPTSKTTVACWVMERIDLEPAWRKLGHGTLLFQEHGTERLLLSGILRELERETAYRDGFILERPCRQHYGLIVEYRTDGSSRCIRGRIGPV